MFYGNGQEYDLTFKCGTTVITTTSQYKVCYISSSGTVDLINTTATARTAIGVIQSYQSAGSIACTVRLHGVSKVYCRDSVTAGLAVFGYEGTSVTGDGVGCIDMKAASITAETHVLGFALEDGQTGQAISIYVSPGMFWNA